MSEDEINNILRHVFIKIKNMDDIKKRYDLLEKIIETAMRMRGAKEVTIKE